ncbi:MAG: flagellar filament capping protein FliD [Desulfovibrionales bacterium]|nr:flagellar filament capping protein FliD [Desulfovibrionales bacterium]
MAGTQLISGLISGLDWRSMVDQLIAVEHKRVDLVANRKSEYESKLGEWRGVNTKLLALKTASTALSTESAFKVFSSTTTSNTSTAASNLLTVSTSSTASPGTYNIEVNNLAQSEKISSKNYAATDTALSLSGDILISGKVVSIASTDTLANIKDKINALNTGTTPTGVTASIVKHSSTDYHLVLRSDETGEDGLSVLEGAYNGGDNILEEMGFISGSTTIKNTTSDGAKSDLFTSSYGAVKTLLGLTSAPGATNVTIGGNSVSIDLSSATESLTTIAQKIDALAGISAEVVSEEVDGETKYRIDISGTTSFTDNGNVLQTLGILEGTYGTVQEVHSGDAIYAIGGAAITAATKFSEIFTGALRGDQKNQEISAQGSDYISASTQWNWINTGGDANDIDNLDTIRVEGTDHDGNAVDQTYTINDNTETLSNFLSWLETQYGGSSEVDAYFDSDGRLVLEDLQSGSSQLSISNVTYGGTNLTFSGTEPFGNNISDNDTITIAGTRGDGTTVSAITYTIADASTNTIQDLLNKIHDGDAGDDAFGETSRTATPSVSGGKITITDDTAGDSQLSLSLIANNEDGGTLNFGTISMTTEGRSMQIAAGEDAEIVVDNVVITNSSNTITDIIEGTTLNIAGESADTTVTLKIERDISAIKEKINAVADAYNAIMEYINTQFDYDEENEKVGGILFGDGTLSSIKSELINTITQTVTGVSSDYNRLPLIGVSLDDDALMTIDDEDLTAALQANFDHVKKLFIAHGSSPNSNLEYVGHTNNTVGGAYDVNITQAGTRTTVTGSKALAATLGEAVTVTITDYATGRVADVSLTDSMDIDDVVNAINSELGEEYTEQLKGDNANAGVTSSTLFNDASVGGDNNDVITFSGTRRNGISVSGSYTISDATTETVGDLLEAIEDMFEDEVTAALDSNGKLVITDTQAGDSNLSFSIDTTALDALNFGTVDVDPTGADGSQEGRYAMTITASEGTGGDANKLILTHNTYGTGHIIVVSQSSASDPLGLDDATQVYGKDVAGTINSVTATGSGQTLYLDSDGNNADGLSINYTGSGTTTTTFTLTLGIADLLERQLGFITDATDGYVTYKQTSLEDSIDSFETQIEQMEASLNRKMDVMISQFVAMEQVIGRLQTVSSWLSSQMTAMFY